MNFVQLKGKRESDTKNEFKKACWKTRLQQAVFLFIVILTRMTAETLTLAVVQACEVELFVYKITLWFKNRAIINFFKKFVTIF